jgi:hypothetical protein
MLIIEHIKQTDASPESVWAIWQDVANWKSWDHGLEFSTIDGPFAAGARGTLKPKGGPVIRTVITELEPLKVFTVQSRLPLTTITSAHYLRTANGKTIITQRIEMRGLLSPLFAYHIGRGLKKTIPQATDRMIQQAKAHEHSLAKH